MKYLLDLNGQLKTLKDLIKLLEIIKMKMIKKHLYDIQIKVWKVVNLKNQILKMKFLNKANIYSKFKEFKE